jgi:hypothetical protein
LKYFGRGGFLPRDDGGSMPQPVNITPEQNNFGITPPTPIQFSPEKPNANMALLAAGLGMMSGQSHNALTNIGQGGFAGLNEYQQQKTANEKTAMEQANVQEANQRANMSYEDAISKARQLADDMDFRRKSHADEMANAAAGRHIQEQELALRQQEAAAGTWSVTGVDPTTQDAIEVNNKTGQLRVTPIPLEAKPGQGGAGGGGRYAGQVTRSLTDAKDVASDLGNIINLPYQSNTGWFGMRAGSGDTTLLNSSWDALANNLTPQQVQDYNTHMVGIGRALAGLETGGTQVQEALIRQFEKLGVAEGDSNLTALRKLATMRQQAVNAMEANMASPYVGKDQKAQFQSAIDQIEKAIPWTPNDVTKLELAHEKNPDVTMGDFAKGQLSGNTSGYSIAPAAIGDRKVGKTYWSPGLGKPVLWTKNGWDYPP